MIKRQIKIKGTDIYISNGLIKNDREVNNVFQFSESQPTIKIFEDNKLIREYLIETLISNQDLKDQFFHSSIRVLKNGAVMIDGIVSENQDTCSDWKDEKYEAIRLQPFFLSAQNQENLKLKGQGLFQRGLHFSGTVTPSGVRVVCICDDCEKSFTLQHFHSGFSEGQYFYSTNSKQTLFVSNDQIENLPSQLQEDISEVHLNEVEQKLPKPTNGKGEYKYYNSFCCPHCNSDFIDFRNNKNIRPNEYYGNYLINEKTQRIEK